MYKRQALDGPNWPNGTADNWLFGDPCIDAWQSLNCTEDGHVYAIRLRSAGLKGVLPAALADMDYLTILDVRDNSIAYPTTSEERVIYDLATRRCQLPGVICYGLPADSCSAFGDEDEIYILSISEPSACDKCPDSLLGPALTFAGLGFAFLMVIAIYIAVVIRYPEALKHWVSTITITINHAQTYAIIGSLGLAWPESVEYVLMLIRFDFRVPNAACVLGSAENSPFWVYSTGFLGGVLMLLGLLILTRLLLEWSDNQHAADGMEFVLSIIFAVSLTLSLIHI